jgi:hypothetical protein
MSEMRKRYDLTAADTKIIGTDYQYFYFINSLLSIRKDQEIGYEVKDDIHITLPSDKLVLIQVKHTVQKNSQGTTINLTERDEDLWKTLSNWVLVICDKNDNRNTLEKQKKFVINTNFVLATNKTINSSNRFVSNLTKFQKNKLTLIEFQKYLGKLYGDTKGEVKSDIGTVNTLNSELLSTFLLNLEVKWKGDSIIENIKTQIKERNIGESRVNDVFNGIFSELKQDFFLKVNTYNKQSITFDEWYQKYTLIFENNRTTTLPLRKYQPVIPKKLEEQIFIQELIAIGEICKDDLVEITEFTSYMLEIKMSLQDWYDSGEITFEQKERFHKNGVLFWRNIHKQCHRNTKKDSSLDNDNALKCLDEVRKKEFKMVNTDLGVDLSNGEFYLLSNHGDIGWLAKWEATYR